MFVHCSQIALININSLPHSKILDWSKLKQFADNNFKFDENGRQFSKQVENTVGKGGIAGNEQFLLFPKCFQKTCTETRKNQGLFWKRLTLYHTAKF